MNKFYELIFYLLKKFFEEIFQIINLVAKRFLKPFWVIFFIVIYMAAKNWQAFFKAFSIFDLTEYELIRKYIETLTSLPIVILSLGLIFIFKFSNSIKTFLENSNLKQAGPFGFGQQQQAPSSKDIEDKVAENLEERGVTLTAQQLQQIDKAFQEKETQLANKDNVIKYLIERAELFEFAYLNSYLVFNSKTALLWIFLRPTTRENFLANFSLPPQIFNPLAEKEAILNTLLINHLIESRDGLLLITDKGKRFLRYLGYNTN